MKEFYLNEEDNIVRSDRLHPLTKPRSIARSSVEQDHFSALQEFDLEQGEVYHFSELNFIGVENNIDLETYPYLFETDYDVLCWASALLNKSALGSSLLKEATTTGWKILISDLGTGGFHLDVEEKIIELDGYGLDASSLGKSSFFRTSLIYVLAKSLRDIWQENRWGAFDNIYKSESTLLLERARAADSDAVSILIGWELRSVGYNDIWRHVLASDEGDMAQVLINILDRHPTALYNGMALAHIFRQWYADAARIDALDHTTLEQMDFNLRDKSLVAGDATATPSDFEKLSILPDGVSYLKELGETVSRDPFFAGLNDPINQAHLFQIIYDNKVTYVDGIPFRDPKLARKFFAAD